MKNGLREISGRGKAQNAEPVRYNRSLPQSGYSELGYTLAMSELESSFRNGATIGKDSLHLFRGFKKKSMTASLVSQAVQNATEPGPYVKHAQRLAYTVGATQKFQKFVFLFWILRICLTRHLSHSRNTLFRARITSE